MEDNLISKLSFIQESTNMSFKTDYDSGVNADAEVALIYISSLLTKRIDELSDDEKAYLEKVENMLGVQDYKKLKELIWSFMVAEIQNVHVVDEKKLQDKFDRIKGLLENDIVINDPLKMNTIKQWITNDRRANLSLLRSTIGHTGKRILPIDYADHIKDSINLRKAPGEDKLKYLCDFLYDEFIGQIKNMYTNIAETSGMDHKYAELYGDFSSGMLMESFAAISGAGIKSANALKNGEAIYDGEVVAGSGIGNLGGKEKIASEGVNKAENIITDGSHIQNGKLKPNSIYKSGEHDYIYKTNQDGLIINAKTDKLELKNHEGRLKHDANTLGKQEGDHAGHLFGDRFGGSPELDNVVSQAKKVNLSEYKVIENQWAKALKKGQKVTVDINVNYLPGVERPISFDVFYTINGVPFFQTITQ